MPDSRTSFPSSHASFDLVGAARQTMLDNGFQPDMPAAVVAEAQQQQEQAQQPGAAKDLRTLLWSSIDNDTSRDLDQIEWAERTSDGGIRVLVGIADVDSMAHRGGAIDQYAYGEGTTVYSGVRNFPMLPEVLSTDKTSLLENVERLCIVIEMVVASDGSVGSRQIYPALVVNRAQLTYNDVGPFLEGQGAGPAKLETIQGLAEQLKLQDEAAQILRKARQQRGALNIDSVETEADMANGQVVGLHAVRKNRASVLIEDLMIAANQTMAETLTERQVPSIRRIVKSPERWPRIVALAAQYGEHLPDQADAGALNAFLMKRKAVDPVHSPDLSLSVMKLMGPGEYVVLQPGGQDPGHFGLAVQGYTHSTAPNRRYADLVTQRLLKASAAGQPQPYSGEELDGVARQCTLREDAARKVERVMAKRIAAVALSSHIGQEYDAVVTGRTPKGTFVRILQPPVEGRVMQGEQGLDVGDRTRVRLLRADPAQGFIDFARI